MTAVSVVVPTRDQAARLEATLHAFTRQTAPAGSWELVVVDDGSTDTTAEVLRTAARHLPLHTVHTPANGRAAARNTGVRAAGGEVIVFCDGDRAPVPGYVSAHTHAHTRPDRDARRLIVVGDIKELYLSTFEQRLDEVRELLTTDDQELRRRSRTPAYVKKVRGLYDAQGRTDSPARWLSFLSGNVSLRRDLYDQVGGFDEDFTGWGLEHLELGYRLAAHGATFRHCPAARNDHFAHGRPHGFYRTALENSAARFERKHPRIPARLLLELTLGAMTVTEFEAATATPQNPASPRQDAPRPKERWACSNG